MANSCPICFFDAKTDDRGGGPQVECPRCGHFTISDIACEAESLKHATLQQRANLSGWIREHQSCVIKERDLDSLLALRTPSVAEKAEKLLFFLAQKHPKPGEVINLVNYKANFFEEGKRYAGAYGETLYGVCWCQDRIEFEYVLDTYLRGEKEFVKSGGFTNHKVISPAGWAYLHTLTQTNSLSAIAFIAMWFDKSVDQAHSAIEIGIRDSGYEALRSDRKQHNNKIDDEIIAGIRRSKFLVADFTGHRGGVYFEAGLATGLGLPVIWLCRKDELEKTHFDTRQYNFIVWEPDKLDELSTALKNRIEATIGRGPLQSAT